MHGITMDLIGRRYRDRMILTNQKSFYIVLLENNMAAPMTEPDAISRDFKSISVGFICMRSTRKIQEELVFML
jgi:hypothetical protein